MADASHTAFARQDSDKIHKLDNCTWFGHLVVHLHYAMRDLSDEGRLALIHDLMSHLRRYECDLIRRPRNGGAHS